MGEHAYFSPSGASRWIECPASLYLSEKIIDRTSSYAHEGTICHDIAANCLTKKQQASDYAGQIVEGVAITQELVDGVQMYVDEVQGLTQEYSCIGGRIEHKVVITEHCWGTIDAMLWNKDTVITIDLKMGKGIVVAAEDNNQLKIYSVGALRWLLDEYKIMPEKVINIIIQPRTPNPIRKTELDRKELGDWFNNKVHPVIKMHEKGKPSPFPCNPGEAPCKWCKVKRCKARAQKNINDAARAFAPFTKVETPKIETATSGSSVSPKLAVLTIAEMAELKKSFKAIQGWIKDIEETIRTEALNGVTIPGYKLVEGRSDRAWKDTEEETVLFLEGVEVKGKPIDPYTKKLISPTQAIKLMGKKIAEKSAIVDWVIKPPGKPTLVLATDKRPEYKLKGEIENDFKKVEPVKTLSNTEPLLVDEEKEVPQMSVMQRMQFAEFDNEETEETATGSNAEQVEQEKGIVIEPDDTPVSTIMSVSACATSSPPAKGTKRYQLLGLGGGEVTIRQAAVKLGCSENMIKMHLRYLNERDGYGYEVFSDGTFKVF